MFLLCCLPIPLGQILAQRYCCGHPLTWLGPSLTLAGPVVMAAVTGGAHWRCRGSVWVRAAWWLSLTQIVILGIGCLILLQPDLTDWLGRRLAGL